MANLKLKPGVITGNALKEVFAYCKEVDAALPAVVGKVNYICGFVVTSVGTTTSVAAAVVVSGTAGGSLPFEYNFVSSGQGILGIAFPQCIGASGGNTAITVSVGAGGAGTTAALSVWGFQTQD